MVRTKLFRSPQSYSRRATWWRWWQPVSLSCVWEDRGGTTFHARYNILQANRSHTIEQRISVVTLGVTKLERSRNFYERLEWRRSIYPAFAKR